MSYQEYNVLVVDDDKNFAASLRETITRAGFRCYDVHTPKEALNYVKLQDVHVIIIDCMLPKMNGLELVKKVRETMHGEPILYLISGIFKDKQFINSAISKSGAQQFLTKPFDAKKLVADLESQFSGLNESDDGFNPLVRLYLNRETNTRKIIKLINGTEGLHNFDLPWIFKILLDCKATGHLNIACTNGDIAGVGFSKGNIVQVNIKKEASLLGLLLVEQGYLDRGDLNDALEANTNNKMIGQFLVESNLVSPHAISIVLKEQLIWRLKRLMADSQMELNFVKSNEVATIANVDEKDFKEFMIDTIENTIRIDWLRSHYMPLSQNLLELNDDALKDLNNARIFPFVSKIYPTIESSLQKGTTLEELLANNQTIENSILKVIHFFNIMELVHFKNVHKTINFSHQAKRLKKLENELEGKNYFERLGVSRSAKDGDIRKAYFDLAKVLHPDKLTDKTPVQIKELSEKVFSKIQVAYDTLKKEERKTTYLEELEAGQSEKLMQADQFFDTAKNLIATGQYSQAHNQIKKAVQLNSESPEMRTHLLWVEMKLNKNISEAFLADIDKKLNLVPLESRDTAAFYHTRGLYFKLMNDSDRAKKYFLTAINIDSGFISARRELSQLKSNRESVSLLTADLKDVVGFLFKK